MRTIFVVILFFSCALVEGQVGVIVNEEEALDGYTLFQPNNYTSTFLIDNEGFLVHEWSGTLPPGKSVYLIENGNLLRTGDVSNSSFSAGGRGGRIEIVNWEGDVIWSFEISNEKESHHHDVAYLPNGNILAIVWDKLTGEEAIASGRDPSKIGYEEVWLEKIVEIKPVGSDQAQIVWEWRLFNHLVQDYDQSKLNYDEVAKSPGKVNFNYTSSNEADWIHMNSISYNATLDQIMVSSPFLNEVWIIDHSTTTQEAATDVGGNANRGGRLLFRWGNAAVYNQASFDERRFFGQHNAQWLFRNDEWKMLVFNNGNGRPESYSSVEIVNLLYDQVANSFALTDDKFGPTDAEWEYTSPVKTDFYSRIISGVQELPNGNFLVCEGVTGRLFEIDQNEEIVWEYVNPVNFSFSCVDDNPNGAPVFRASKYPSDYSGFPEDMLASYQKLDEKGCEEEVLGNSFPNEPQIEFKAHSGSILITADERIEEVHLVSLDGKYHLKNRCYENTYVLEDLENTIYIVRVRLKSDEVVTKKLLVSK